MSNSLQPHELTHQATVFFTVYWKLFKFMSIKSVTISNHLILCHHLLLLPSIFPSIRVFSNESVLCIRGPNYWNFSLSITPSNEYSGLISFRIDWFDLHAVQGTLKSLLQHHSSKTSIIWHWAFFMVQLSHPYTTTGKTIALIRCHSFLSKEQLSSNSMAAVTIHSDFGAQENNICHSFHSISLLFSMKWSDQMPLTCLYDSFISFQ